MLAYLNVIDLGFDVRVELLTFAPMTSIEAIDLVRRAGRLVDADGLAVYLRFNSARCRPVVVHSGEVVRPNYFDPRAGDWFALRLGNAIARFKTSKPFHPVIEVY